MNQKEDQSTILSHIKDRVTDPFLSNFFICFIIFNWKVFYILLLENKSAIDRINFIEQNYFPDSCTIFIKISIPFGISLLWFLFFPRVKRLIVNYHTKRKMEIEKGRIDIENDLKFANRLSVLEQKEVRLNSLEEFIIRKYREFKHKPQSNYSICKCNDAQLGDWIHLPKDSDRGSLAFLNKDFTNLASGVVVELLQNDYVLIQTYGEVIADEIGIREDIRRRANARLYLSKSPGRYRLGPDGESNLNQKLGSFSGTANNTKFLIKFDNEETKN
ncbi:hypothetical protein [Leptospira bouyouniensis]|uniref:hypothetical protein n=1 Tax=Leptospira bouyouniensis TaxID=2484911 RepID=UPI001090E039|nr:hypothetical protein [Leptospira bouyouniensis]TGM88283.1 hypothetical protein EHQ99_00260 [Leptospira bouyouniensis]